MTVDTESLQTLETRARTELIEGILPFWMTQAVDEEYGGFVGQITQEGLVLPEAPKGAVLNTRILWSFASAAHHLQDDRYRSYATRAYRYLLGHFQDAQYGGIYWMLDHKGRPVETKKQVYAQAFAIYGLVEYYRTTGEEAALVWAIDLFNTLERHSHDGQHGGYFEAFGRAWGPLADVRLSERDANEAKSMNTHLHVLEAYTTLYNVWPDPLLKRQLHRLVTLFVSKILDSQHRHLNLFFDADWTLKSGEVSFGHDIEASWLLTEAAVALADPVLIEAVTRAALSVAHATLEEGVAGDGSLLNEVDTHGLLDDDRHWWPQAEAVVGFLNAYQLTRKPAFLDAARAGWAYIENCFIDRERGEWFFRVSEAGTPYTTENKVGPWKGPYHNTRACLEIIKRVAVMAKTL